LNTPLAQLPIEALLELGPSFRLYLQQRRYKSHSVRSYRGFIKILVSKAKDLGWRPRQSEIPQCWKPILPALKAQGLSSIVRYAIRNEISSSNLSEDDLIAWADTLLADNRSLAYVNLLKARFRRTLVKSGLGAEFPHIYQPDSGLRKYAVPLRYFEPALREEVTELLEWKQAEFAPGRPRKSRIRAVTAWRLEQCITGLYGFVTNVNRGNSHGDHPVTGVRINSLLSLVTKDLVTAFVGWRINSRGNKSSSLSGDLALLHAAMRYYPAYKGHEFKWLGDLIAQLPEDRESEIVEDKARKYIPYAELADIPRKLHDRREEISIKGKKELAWLIHDEFLMRWLATLVWRQRNIRECRVGSKPELVNLFKSAIPPFVTMAKPKWIAEQLAIDPRKQFWQFHFREEETKNGHEVRAFLPRQLVGPLEEYVVHHRPTLFEGRDPGTLFMNRVGSPLTSNEIRDLVANITCRYAQRRVTPHVCRDILAYAWLDHHPEDYLSLSKILWHRNVNTTLQKYGRRFDESNGMRKLEEWLG
jgi:hypothetical protein